jgi:hypothetical protein
MAFFDFNTVPGLGSARTTSEVMFLWGRHENVLYRSGVVKSTATDNGNTSTTELRPGLLLAQLSTGKWVPYSPTGTDGSQYCSGILSLGLKMTDLSGTTSDRVAPIVVGGPVKANQLIYNAPVQATTSLTGPDQQARAQMSANFTFDDVLTANTNPWINVLPKTAAYTVVAADTGTEFTNTGATGSVTFTLPSLLDANSNPVCKGCIYRFTTTAAQALVVQSAVTADKVLFYNNATSRIATFTNKVGITLEVRTDDTGTKWIGTTLGTVTTDITMS